MVEAKELLHLVKSQITEVDAKDKGLEGELIIENYPNLKRIEVRNNRELTSIKLINLPKLNYFHANNCQLTEIKIDNCSEIDYFNIANNLLTDISFLDGLNSEKLTVLSIHTNDFDKQDLSFISKFTKLQQLFLDNCDEEKFEEGIYNKFFGSLQPLQTLTKLEILSIGKTNIDSGLEYLPQNFRKIGLTTAFQADTTGCAKLRQELEKICKIEDLKRREKNSKGEEDPAWFDDYYRIAPWREAKLTIKRKKIDLLKKRLEKYAEIDEDEIESIIEAYDDLVLETKMETPPKT